MKEEFQDRTVLNVGYCGKLCTLLLNWERLRWWFISVEDRQQRLNLVSLGRVRRAEVHCRVAINCYESMAWEHLLMHLIQGREKAHRVAIKLQQKKIWEVVMQQQRVEKPMGLQQMVPLSTHLSQEKAEDPKTVPGGRGGSPVILLEMQPVEFYTVHFWSIEYSNYVGRKWNG